MAYTALRTSIAGIRGDAAAALLALTEEALLDLADLAEEAADDSEAEAVRADEAEEQLQRLGWEERRGIRGGRRARRGE